MAGIFLAATDISAITAALHWRRSFGADLHCRLALFGRAAGLRRLFISSIRDIQPRRRNISPIHDIRFFCRSGAPGVTGSCRLAIFNCAAGPGRLAASQAHAASRYSTALPVRGAWPRHRLMPARGIQLRCRSGPPGRVTDLHRLVLSVYTIGRICKWRCGDVRYMLSNVS